MLFPKQLNIKTTGVCNATCSFCGYNKNALKKSIQQGQIPFKLNVPKFIQDLPKLKKKGIGILHFTGGEPFLEAKFIDIITRAKKLGFQVRTGTNGSMLNEDMVKKIKDSGLDFLWYSLDTYPYIDHLTHRGFEKAQNKMEKGIELLHKYNVNFFGQTVISKVLPTNQGLPDLEGHIKYYKAVFGIRKFVFSYPMYRPYSSQNQKHLATLGSNSVNFTTAELISSLRKIMWLKKNYTDVTIINPYLSLFQQIEELKGAKTKIGCYAGNSIFFMGEDQTTLRPCYTFSDDIIDNIDNKPLKASKKYRDCSSCMDQCFRDPSIVYSVLDNPQKFMMNLINSRTSLSYSLMDLWDVVSHKGYKSYAA